VSTTEFEKRISDRIPSKNLKMQTTGQLMGRAEGIILHKVYFWSIIFP
jgi:hypothetical protein